MRFRQINLRKLWLSLLLLVGVTAIAVPGIQEVMDGNVAKIGSTEYATLQAAFDAAQDGETVTLLSDYSATGETNTIETNRNLCVTKSITIDGQNHTLTVNKRGIAVKGISSKIDVTFKDITIQNSVSGGRCIDTRGNIGTLTIIDSKLSTGGGGYDQPLTIGGNQSDAATVNITNSTIQTNDAGTAYYAIITFNPVNMNITESTIKGWACIYAKGPDGSSGSAGSVFDINNSTIVSSNAYSGVSNDFSAIMIEDNNVSVNVDNSNITINNTGDQVQTLVGYNGFNKNGTINLGEGNIVNFAGPNDCDLLLNGTGSTLSLTGGTYNFDPTNYLAEGYTAVENNGKWTVQEKTYVAQIGDTKFETLADAVGAAAEGQTIQVIKDGDYTLPNLPQNVTIEATVDGVVFNHTAAGSVASIPDGATFKNVAFNFGNENYHGFQAAGTINMEGCTINGKLFSYGDMNFTNCQFKKAEADYNMWCYGGDIYFKGCTFERSQKGHLHLYNEGNGAHKVTVEECNFINNGDANKAAINVKATCGSKLLAYDVIINNCTTEGAFPEASWGDALVVLNPVVQVDDRTASGVDNITVTQDGVLIYPVTVAAIGETKYPTLQSALDAAHEMTGDVTITLLDDITGYSIVHQKAGLNLTIDGDDKTVNGQIIVDGNGRASGTETLSIQNIKFEGNTSDFISASDDAFILIPSTKATGKPYTTGGYNYAHNITVSGCSFTSTSETFNVVGVKAPSGAGAYNVVITECTGTNLHSLTQLTGTTGGSVTKNTVTSSESFMNVNGGGGEFIVSENTFTSAEGADGYGIRENAGSSAVITLTDNTFNAAKAVVLGKGGSATNGTINVVSGTYVGDIVKDIAATATGKIVISGGKFSAPLADAQYAEFIADGLCGVNGLYEGDAPNGIGEAIATMTSGETVLKYASLEAAFAAAVDGSTITLLKSTSGNGIKVPEGKYSTGLTVDFGGFTYTVDGTTVGSTGTETQAFQLLKDNKITFKNGTIYSEKAKMLVQNYSNLTLEGMTLTLDNANYTSAYTLSNNNGNVVIDGTTINANPAGGFAFDVCRYSSYPSVGVTVKGESVINGDIEVSASGSDPKDGFGLTLEAGTFNGNIVLDASAEAVLNATPEKAVIKKSNSLTTVAAPQDYKWVDNGDETSTLAPCVYVAQIGDVKYESLADAVAAVSTDGTETTITMIADHAVASGITIAAGKNIVLELNGKVVSYNSPAGNTQALITNRGTLVIQDNTDTAFNGTGTGLIGADYTNPDTGEIPGYASNTITNGGTLTLKSGKIVNTATGGAACYVIDNNSTTNNAILNIEGGYVYRARSQAVRMFCNSTTYQNTLNISGGIVEGGYAGFWTQLPGSSGQKKLATINITGGEVKGGEYSWYDYSFGDSFEAVDYSISDGKFTGYIYSFAVEDGVKPGFISGGLFTVAVDENYCAEGYIPTTNTDPATKDAYPYTVKLGQFVAQIGDVKYETLEEAWNAVNDGEAIKLLADCAGNGIKAPQGKFTTGITVDFDGHTYTMDGSMVGSTGTETQAFQLLKDNKITFKNGTIYSEKALMLIQNYSDLTLEGMTLTLKNANYNDAYTLSNNNGNIVIDGTTINANPAGSTAFDVCRYSSYTSVNVTVKGESVINGDIEVDAGAGDPKEGMFLTVEAGTITGNLRLTDGGATAITDNAEKAAVKKNNNVTLAAPADYKWKDNGDGTSTLVPCEYVAQIGEKKYESLEEAWNAVNDGETIKLLADCAGNGIKAQQGKFTTGITVDFDGHTYTMDGSMVGSTGTETQAFQLLKDNRITFKNGTIYSEKALMLIQNYCDLTLEGMTLTLKNENYNDAYTLSNNNGNIVIDGTTINANPAGSTAFDVCRYSSYTSVNVTVKGESVINGDIEVDAGAGDPKEGMFLTVEAGTINGNLRLTEGGATAITDNAEKAAVKKNNNVMLAAPADYKWKDNGDGTSTLVPCEYICAIGTTKYETLAEAVAAAGTAETTITLLTDAATDGVISGDGVVVPSGSNITFDLNGLTYNVSGETVGSSGTKTSGFQLLKDSDITFKNGTLKATSPTAQMLIQNYSNLTLENVNLDGTALSGWAYALSNNCGTINLTGSTSITAKSGGRAFDTCKFGSYAIPTVNINTTGAITGPIEATGGKLNIENGKFNVTWVTDNNYAAGDIQIKGGVFSAEPAEEYCAKGYVATDNEDEATKAEYPFAVMTKEDAGIFELIDGKVYPYLDYTEDKPAASVTYKRNFANNNWQALFIPFDINDVTKLTDKYEFAKVHMVALENDGTFTTGNKIEIYYTRVTSGKLSANQPYLIKLKNEAEQGWQDIVVENTILKDTHNMTPRKTSTMAADYYFTGTYEGYVGEKYHDFMAMGSGTINWGNTGHKLGTYRWYIKTVPFNDDYAKTTISFIEADEDATSISAANADENTEIEGYYSVNGVRSDVPVKGMNIVKYKNGKTKKIMIK